MIEFKNALSKSITIFAVFVVCNVIERFLRTNADV